MRPLHQIACRVVTVTQEQMALKRKQESVTNIKPTTSMRIRDSRFFSDRYAYRERARLFGRACGLWNNRNPYNFVSG